MRHAPTAILLACALTAAPLGTSVAHAAPEPFVVNGDFDTIDTGDVDAAGESGRFVVKDRTVEGTFFGSIGGDAGASFTFVYGSNVPIATQSGEVHGRLHVGDYEVDLVLTSSIGLTPLSCAVPDGATCFETPEGNFIPGLMLEGTGTFLDGAHGNGDFEGWLIPILDAEGHILAIYASSLSFAGEWIQ
jgi:hypothetical protein